MKWSYFYFFLQRPFVKWLPLFWLFNLALSTDILVLRKILKLVGSVFRKDTKNDWALCKFWTDLLLCFAEFFMQICRMLGILRLKWHIVESWKDLSYYRDIKVLECVFIKSHSTGFAVYCSARGGGVLSGKVGTRRCNQDRVPFWPTRVTNDPFLFDNWFIYRSHFSSKMLDFRWLFS